MNPTPVDYHCNPTDVCLEVKDGLGHGSYKLLCDGDSIKYRRWANSTWCDDWDYYSDETMGTSEYFDCSGCNTVDYMVLRGWYNGCYSSEYVDFWAPAGGCYSFDGQSHEYSCSDYEGSITVYNGDSCSGSYLGSYTISDECEYINLDNIYIYDEKYTQFLQFLRCTGFRHDPVQTLLFSLLLFFVY